MRFFLRHVALLVRHFQNFGCEIGYSVFIYYLLVYIFACFWPATGMSRSPSSRVRSGSPMRRNQAYEGKKYAGYHLDFNFPSLIVPKHGVTQKDDVKAGEMGNLIGVKTALDGEFDWGEDRPRFRRKDLKIDLYNSRSEKSTT